MTVIKCWPIRFALSLAMVSRKMVCRLRMYLRRGGGMLGRWWGIGTWDRGEGLFE